ncbi:hypothetical protein ERJ75_001504200 [Trypanosoma vivax]|nr:hypothetical protein ERJ75_001504200 [Trypanosoma vivax]
MNETALLLTNRTLEQLEAQIKLWGPNLTKINSSVHDVTVAMGNAEHIRETAKTAAASAVSDVLRSLMREVCASAAELYEQHTKNNGFKGKTEAFKNNVSAESRRAGTEWKRDNDLSGMPQDVEDGFTYASKSVAVLKKHIRRADAQYVKVVSELEKSLPNRMKAVRTVTMAFSALYATSIRTSPQPRLRVCAKVTTLVRLWRRY